MRIKKRKNATLICKLCGAKETPNTYFTAPSMWRKEMCFSCDLWTRRAEELKTYPEHTIAIANGTYYCIGDENTNGIRGFGGAKVKITFNDGTEIISTNLWCGGDIPDHLRTLLPDNAKLEWLH